MDGIGVHAVRMVRTGDGRSLDRGHLHRGRYPCQGTGGSDAGGGSGKGLSVLIGSSGDAETKAVILSDDKGRKIFVPAGSLAYVEVGEASPRRVGFGPRSDQARIFWGLICAVDDARTSERSFERERPGAAGAGRLGHPAHDLRSGHGVEVSAEDPIAIRTVVGRALARQGYEVQATSVASALWRWIAAGEGDVVITDVQNAVEGNITVVYTLLPA